jgi:two-component system chemotaxis response regulator CheB
MAKKVLIVDDSALMRRVLSDIINSDERFLVCKAVRNGLEALTLLKDKQEEYDAVILDINMPQMGGLEFLEELNRNRIKATVIIVSTVATEGAKETIRALELGAFDFVTKPESFYDIKNDKFKNKIIECLVLATNLYQVSSKEITPALQTEWKKKVDTSSDIQPVNKMIHGSTMTNSSSRQLVVIASSTGGPKALQQVVPLITKNLDCSVLIVQHMPEGFTLSLANRLNELSSVRVKEAEHDELLSKGVVYIAKGGNQIRLNSFSNGSYQLSVTAEAARRGLRPCADILFESLIQSDFNKIICVVLTGMGSDGTLGIKQLKEKKNVYVIAQNEATCTVYGMPKVVAEAGLVNEVLPLNQIANAINKNMEVR